MKIKAKDILVNSIIVCPKEASYSRDYDGGRVANVLADSKETLIWINYQKGGTECNVWRSNTDIFIRD